MDLFDKIDPPKHTTLTRACPCGSHHFRVEPGQGPHAAGLRCAVCGRHGGWMTKADYMDWRGRPADMGNWETWVKENPPPSLQDLVAKRGMYSNITPEDWADWDARNADWEQRRRDRLR